MLPCRRDAAQRWIFVRLTFFNTCSWKCWSQNYHVLGSHVNSRLWSRWSAPCSHQHQRLASLPLMHALKVKTMQCPHVCMFDKNSCFSALCPAPYQKIHPLGFLESLKSTCSLQRQVVRWEVASCVVLLKYDTNSLTQDHTRVLKAYEHAPNMAKFTFSKWNFDPNHYSVAINC
jgi:hypothetical protein